MYAYQYTTTPYLVGAAIEAHQKQSYDINAWPYPALDYAWDAGIYTWREVSEAIYYDQLEAVPPIRMHNGFFVVGEPWDIDEKGEIYTVFAQVKSRYFARHDHLFNFANLGLYRFEIEIQFGLE
jgi:hypothetical protein